MGLLDRVGRFLDDVLLLPEDVRDALETGDDALRSELFPEAERMFLEVLATRPGLGRAALGLARARAGMRDDAGDLGQDADQRVGLARGGERAGHGKGILTGTSRRLPGP